MPHGKTWQVVAGSAAIGLAVAAGAVAAAGPWDAGQRTAEREHAAGRDHVVASGPRTAMPTPRITPPAPSAAPVLAPVPAAAPGTGKGSSAGTPPDPAALKALLDPLMDADGLGTVRTGTVIDVATGTVVYDHRAGTPSTPASTTKLATATAALGTLGPGRRLTTTVVVTAAGRVVLVGGGDPTLELGGLADDTAAALKARGTTSVRLGYDTSLFSGTALHPIGPNENLAPVTALMVREGRLDHSSSGPAQRADDPAESAADAFADLLRERGIRVKGEAAPAGGHGGTRLAAHQSAPLSELVERMLTDSDNDVAEALARHVARALGRPASFAGAASAIPDALRRLGVPLAGAAFHDGSGLDGDDALSATTLARILALAASPAHPEMRSVLTGLPVAGFTGTLADRFRGGGGAGVVHAKTGTLTGTNTIAGTAVSPAGRLLAFAFLTHGTDSPGGAQKALDHLAAALTTHP
ncbi:D-alanyl-D-alanine carboxypeptidase/D-alanyl-D-alanine-endopeptidase [Streptomyces sp. NPDC008317]|uniref:D-alanyl-D-alanine carboxypeptidase/D-alanyl-D-alanine endopeptidase n=1 Tax=Streptomyces sp. NPDC008317 TaxID=3364827 RepID=UPI0036F0747E